MSNNYDKQVLIARELFVHYEQSVMIEKFHLQADKEFLYLPLLHQISRISRTDGRIALRPAASEEEWQECLDYNTVMTIYDVLCYAKQLPVLSHQWVPLSDLQVTMSSPNADIFTRKFATAFSGQTSALLNICRQIGGRPIEILAGADFGWEFDLFPFFPIQLRFWDQDDEFPPQIRLLWDKNTLNFMHFETVYYAMHILLETLLAKLQSSRQTSGQ